MVTNCYIGYSKQSVAIKKIVVTQCIVTRYFKNYKIVNYNEQVNF